MPGGLNGPPITSGGAYTYPNKTRAQLRAEVLIRLGFISRIPNAPTRTRALMRADVLTALGFIDPLTPVPTRTMLYMRNALIESLGLPDPLTLTGATRTMVELRQDVAYAVGMAQSTWPPGFTVMMTRFIEEAHQRVWRRLEMDNGESGAAPPARIGEVGSTSYDYVPVQLLAIALMKSQYGQPDAKVYFDQLEQYLADRARRRPPNIEDIATRALTEAQETIYRRYELGIETYALAPFAADVDLTTIDYRPVLALATGDVKAWMKQPDFQRYHDEVERYVADLMRRHPPNIIEIVNTALREAQETVYRRYELGIVTYALGQLTADGDATTIDYRPVVALATADVKALFKQPDAKRYYDELERYMADLQRRKPPEADELVNNALMDAQEQMYMRYTSLRGDQWWQWTLVPGERFYDVVKDGTINVDFRKVDSVWIVHGNVWDELREGINPNDFSHDAPGVPYSYELREYIEVWPAPSEAMTLHLFGHLGLKSFSSDADTATIDYHLIFLKALAMCKAHYGQRDASGIDRDAQVHLGQLVAASHGNRRYIPNDNRAGLSVSASAVDYGMNVRREEGGGVRRMEDE